MIGDVLAAAESLSLPADSARGVETWTNGRPEAAAAAVGGLQPAATDEQRRMCFSRVLGTENGVEHQTQVSASRPTLA